MSDAQKYIIRRKPARNSGTIAEYAGVTVAVLYLGPGEEFAADTDCETAWLLMDGKLDGKLHGEAAAPVGDAGFSHAGFTLERHSLFDESASCVHAATGTSVTLRAITACELTVYQCPNRGAFPARVYMPADVPNEHRGKGQVAERCLRFVRTIFDGSNAAPNAEMVLGEVVTLPGGWSSYPPHHHRQPEIYHYRFTAPQGYGHAELGDDVFKVNDGDTICIPPGLDHAQCAAPGYGMYYSWVIRHLPGDRYTIPDFTEEHAWTMDKDAEYWWPADVAAK